MDKKFLIFVFIFVFFLRSVPTFAEYIDWGYRKQHNITGSLAGNQTDYQIRINVTNTTGTDSGDTIFVGGLAKNDLGDIRFTWYNATDDTETVMDYKNITVYSNHVIYYFEAPEIHNLTTINNTIYIYYGNDAASSIGDGDATFLLYDHFLGSSLDGSKWSSIGSPSVADSKVTITGTADGSITSVDTFGLGTAVTVLGTMDWQAWGWAIIGYGRLDDVNNALIYQYGGPGLQSGRSIKDSAQNTTNLGENEAKNTWFEWEVSRFNSSRLEWSVNGTTTLQLDDTWIPTGSLSVVVGDLRYSSGDEFVGDLIYVRKRVYPEPSHGDWGSIEDRKVPEYSNDVTNGSAIDTPVNFTLDWTDGVGLSGYIFSTNNTGTWLNASYVTFSGTSNTSWNVTTLNDTLETLVAWCFYANDTSDNWNGTSCDTPFTLTTEPVTTNYTFDLRVADVDDNPIDSADVDINSTVAQSYCHNHSLTTNSTGEIDVVDIAEGECNPYRVIITAAGFDSHNFIANITGNTNWHLPMYSSSNGGVETVYCVWYREIEIGNKKYILCVDQNARVKLFFLSGLSFLPIPFIKRRRKK